MKKSKISYVVLAFLLSGIVFLSCKKDDDDDIEFFSVSQDALDKAINEITSATGDFAHGGPEGTVGDSTIREIFASRTGLTGELPVGTVVTKKTYKKNPDGSKGDLYVAFAMVKQAKGYYNDGGDWEYIRMPASESNDYVAHPFGMLPAKDSEKRGKLASCAGCHLSANGGDFLYSND